MSHPEFLPSLAARIAEALLALLRADPALAAWAKGGIEAVELEDLALAGDVLTPAVWVALGGELEDARPGESAELETQVTILLLTRHPQSRGTEGWLRSRVAHHLRRRVLGAEGGLLRDPQGAPLTEALTAFRRLPPGRLRAQPDLILTQIDVVFRSLIETTTGGFLGG